MECIAHDTRDLFGGATVRVRLTVVALQTMTPQRPMATDEADDAAAQLDAQALDI